MLSFEKITRENIGDIAYEKVVAFTFAEVGAMGSGGEVEIVVYDGEQLKGYRTDYQRGVFERTEDIYGWRKEQELVFELLPVLRTMDFNRNMIRRYGRVDDWSHFSTGYGNHLMVRCKYEFDVMEKFGGTPVGELYKDWKKYIETWVKNNP